MVQSVLIVLGVMLITLGLRTGLLVASLIPTTMVVSLLFMAVFDIGLDQVSLAALIIALGMLVDNAIVMTESIMVQIREGKSPKDAAIESASELRVPLLTASLTTAAAFLPIYLAESAVGEYTNPLFKVVTIALLCSWGLALTMIPLLCTLFLSPEKLQGGSKGLVAFVMKIILRKRGHDPEGSVYDTPFYRGYRGMLGFFLRFKYFTIVGALIVFFVAMVGFGYVRQLFFPQIAESQFTAEINLPLGTPIERTETIVGEMEDFLAENYLVDDQRKKGVTNWASFIAAGPPRFVLSYNRNPPAPEYAFMIINTTSPGENPEVIAAMRKFAFERYPDIDTKIEVQSAGPPVTYPIEVRLSGRDTGKLFTMVDEVKGKLRTLNGTTGIIDDWGPRSPKLVIDINQTSAYRAGLTNQDIAISLLTNVSGLETSQYREEDRVIPITLRAKAADRDDFGRLESLAVYSQQSGRNVPLKQVADTQIAFEPSKVLRRNRLRTVTVKCQLEPGLTATEITDKLIPWLDEQQDSWGLGYRYALGGEMESSVKANQSIADKMPIAGFIILILLITQFNSIRPHHDHSVHDPDGPDRRGDRPFDHRLVLRLHDSFGRGVTGRDRHQQRHRAARADQIGNRGKRPGAVGRGDGGVAAKAQADSAHHHHDVRWPHSAVAGRRGHVRAHGHRHPLWALVRDHSHIGSGSDPVCDLLPGQEAGWRPLGRRAVGPRSTGELVDFPVSFAAMEPALEIAAGSVVADRYRIERKIGSGGSGSVYRARDLTQDDALVALKIGHKSSGLSDATWFRREARILSRLRHPHIAQYAAHGTTASGLPYLATEWFEGHDLHQRLRESPLDEAQAVVVGLQMCQALTAVHGLGIVHRDIKPANIFLVAGAVERVKLIDFGVAMALGDRAAAQRSEVFVGTPSYIPPEQARTPAAVTEKADIYALGAVLYACLTGHAPFRGNHSMAVLTKVLINPVPDVCKLRPDVSRSFGRFLSRLLAKNPADRPSSAQEVARLLAGKDLDAGELEDWKPPTAGTLSHVERRFFSVLVIGTDEARDVDRSETELTTRVIEVDANAQQLADGTEVVVFSTDGSPIEMATSAARSALSRHRSPASLPMAIATGQGVLAGEAPVGAVIDRAVDLLLLASGKRASRSTAKSGIAAPDDTDAGSEGEAGQLVVDDVTAGLIEKRFRLERRSRTGYRLLGESSQPTVVHTLLGKETACVGRERELSQLEGCFQACRSESMPAAVLVTGPAGIGKSRIVHELSTRLRSRGQQVAIWTAFGDPMRTGSSFGMLTQLIHQAMDLANINSPVEKQWRIVDHIGHLDMRDVDRVAAFLGELTGSPFPAGSLMQLREARRDPHLMHDHTRQAWADWLIAEAHLRPIVLILDDLQWSDWPTIRFIDAALRNLEGRPLLVVALADESVFSRFSDLWSDHPVEQLGLGPLSYEACVELASQVLTDAPSSTVAQLAKRCGGNPFYLEELLRSTSDPALETLPGTVLAMVGARLRTLTADERRVLRTASVFGRNFWTAGVASLLDQDIASIDASLQTLRQNEFVAALPTPRYRDQDEYGFQQDLIREAAYATLTPSDQSHAHRRAAEWLEANGESDPAVLAEHYWRGDSRQLALPWLLRAAEQAMGADHFEAVIDYVERAALCDAAGSVLGELRLLEAEAQNWRKEHAHARDASLAAMKDLPPGTDSWAHAAHQLAWAAGSTGQFDDLERAGRQLIEHIPDEPSDIYLASMAICTMPLAYSNRRDIAQELERRLEANIEKRDKRPPGPMLAATMARMKGLLGAMHGKWDVTVDHMTTAVTLWDQLGNQRNACNDEANLGSALYELGQYEHSAAVLRVCLDRAHRTGLTHLHLTFEGVLAMALARSGDLLEAQQVFDSLESADTDPGTEARNRVYRAQFSLLSGDPDKACAEIAAATERVDAESAPPLYAFALAVRARALLELGRYDEALEAAEHGMQILESIGELDEGEALLRLAHAEALHANGHVERAKTAIASARERVLERAGSIASERGRQEFLERIIENRQTLAIEWASGEIG